MKRRTQIALSAVLIVTGWLLFMAAQRGAPARPARTTDGHPNLNGIWQAMHTENWDLEDHYAAPGQLYQMGAIGAVPGGPGVVEGGPIPYKPEMLAKRKNNFANR